MIRFAKGRQKMNRADDGYRVVNDEGFVWDCVDTSVTKVTARFAVRGSRFAVRGSRFAVRGSRFAVRGSRFAVLGGRWNPIWQEKQLDS
jgi:hypothetical protein